MVAVKTKRTERFVRRVYGSIAGYIDGSIPDRHGVGRVFWTTLTYELFKRIHESYRVRSEGGTDDLGNKFKPLKKETIAQRPIGKGNLGKFGLTKKKSGTSFKDRSRGLLSPGEDLLWRKTYSRMLNKYRLTVDENTAKMIAAKIAWSTVKGQGARTKLETLGNRSVLIMRVTDAIYDSLKPSTPGSRGYRPRKNQLYRQTNGMLEIGTLVEYAKFHDATRPVIPADIDPWIDESVDLALANALDHIEGSVL